MLILITGGPGVGRDTLFAGAAAVLGDDARFRFVQRETTEPGRPGSLDRQSFRSRADAGSYALCWQAAGHAYGLRADQLADAAGPLLVVATAARTLVPEASRRYPTRVIEVTAPAALVARRLAALGRSDAVETAARAARGASLPLPVERDVVVNDGTVDQGVRRLVGVLIRLADAAPLSGEARPGPTPSV
jgi:phosphonate metabolism protein PhnN/1,5-bisphosphokinase (PRPP-forming)